MTIEEKIDILVRDYGVHNLMEQNDLTEEEVVAELVRWGLIDLDDYFYTDTDELILNSED